MGTVPRRPQKDGYWFYNVGGINSFAEFAYRIVSGMESRIHLIQNGKYMFRLHDVLILGPTAVRGSGGTPITTLS